MFSADEANALYHEKRKPEVTEQVDRVLRMIKYRAYEGYNYAMYCPRKRLLKETLNIIFDLGYSIRGFEGKYDQRYEYNFFWGDDYLKNPVNVVTEYDDSMDYTRD